MPNIKSVVMLLFVSVLVPCAAHAASSVPRLAVQSLIDGNWEIVVWDRSHSSNITHSPENDFAPLWSNDGRLAYLATTATLGYENSLDGAEATIYVWDGKNTIRIGAVGVAGLGAALPVWSPTGQLAYTGKLRETNHVFVWNGSESVDPLPDADSSEAPVWSADGKLAFVAKHGNAQVIYVWDGSHASAIVENIGIDGTPVWGPGGKLAFTGSSKAADKRETFVWQSGKPLLNASNSAEDDFNNLGWSSDGQLAWISESGVWVWDGQHTTRIVESSLVVPFLHWGTGNRLLLSYQDGQNGYRTVVWDGKKLTTLAVQMATIGTDITWSPDGRVALALGAPGPDDPNSPGPVTITTLTIWKDGTLMPVQQVTDFTAGTWSDDNWLAWAAPTVNGDAVGPNRVYVWNGSAVLLLSDDPADAPAWEPTS